MKNIINKFIKILMVIFMLFMSFGVNNNIINAEDSGEKELKKGVIYQIGDTIVLSKDTWIVLDDETGIGHNIRSGKHELPEAKYDDWNKVFEFSSTFLTVDYNTKYPLYLGYGQNLTGEEIVTGIKCISGNGSQDRPFVFELLFEKELKVGETYYIGDTMVVLNVEPAYIKTDDDNPFKIFDSYHDYDKPAKFTVPTPQYESEHGWYKFNDMFVNESYDSVSLYLNSEELDESKTVIGIKCISGDGTQSNPFAFELILGDISSTDPILIEEITITITPPVAGVEVSGDWETQEPRPEVSIPDDAPYTIVDNGVCWVTGPAVEDEPLGETFEEGEYYYVSISLDKVDGYEFPVDEDDLTINVTNGEFTGWADYNEVVRYATFKVQCKAAPQTKELKVGEKYLIGDTIKLSKDYWICFDNVDGYYAGLTLSKAGEYTLPQPSWEGENEWAFEGVIDTVENETWGFYFIDKAYEESNKPIGMKCISGDGSKTKPFVFDFIFENPIVINTLNFTITSPVAGIEVIGDEDDWDTQDPRPELIGNGKCNITNPFWLTEDMQLFTGTFKRNKYYYIGAYLVENEEYYFPDDSGDLIINVDNGEFVEFLVYEENSRIAIFKVKCKEGTQISELEVGEEYLIGDTIKLNGNTWIIFGNNDTSAKLAKEGDYTLPDSVFDDSYSEWAFYEVMDEVGSDNIFGFFYADEDYKIYRKAIGIRCISGNGDEDNPFEFEPIFDNKIQKGSIYYSGDTLILDENAWIIFENNSSPAELAKEGEYTLPDSVFDDNNSLWGFEYVMDMVYYDSKFGFFYYDEDYDGSNKAIGIRCIDGDGTKANPFVFELLFEKELKPEEVYLIGDKILLNDSAYILTDDEGYEPEEWNSGSYIVLEPNFKSEYGQYKFVFSDEDMYLGFNTGLTGNEKVKGIKCKSGNGEKDDPFVFELMFDTPSVPTIIDKVDITVTPPVAGVTVSRGVETQDPRPEVSIPVDPRYNIYEPEVYWFDDIENYDLFAGTFVENEYYYFGVVLDTEDGYEFVENSSDLTVNITNGEFIKFVNYESNLVAFVGKVKCKPAPQTKELEVGAEYLIGDKIKVSEGTWIHFSDDGEEPNDVLEGEYELPDSKFIDSSGGWAFESFIKVEKNLDWGLYFHDDVSAEKKPIGVKCISGTGEMDDPFVFELMFETTIIDKVDITVTPPVAGVTVTMEGDKNTQNPYPHVSLPDDALYELDEYPNILPAYWKDKNDNYFAGTFVEGEDYYAQVWLRPKDGYNFAEEVNVTANNKTINKDGDEELYYFDGKYLCVYVKVQCPSSSVKYNINIENGYADPASANEGEKITITADEPINESEEFDRWLIIQGSFSLEDETNPTTTFIMPKDDVIIKATYKKKGNITYKIEEGANQTYILDSNINIYIKASGDLAKLNNIRVDEVILNKMHYEVENGSTLLTLKYSFLNTLSPGNHIIEFEYNDGIARTILKVIRQGKIVVPNTSAK